MPKVAVVSEKSAASAAVRSVEGPRRAQRGFRGAPRRAPGGNRRAGFDEGKECRHQNGNPSRHGFDVTGVDYADAAIEKARARASDAGVRVNFIVDDLTNLRHVSGSFDLLLDYGTRDDLRPHQREPYLRNTLPLIHTGGHYLLVGFEYPMRWWEKLVPFFDVPFYPGRSSSASAGISKSSRLQARLITRDGRRATPPT